MPFLADEVVRAALAVPLAIRSDPAFYGRVITLVNPVAAAIPTAGEEPKSAKSPRARSRRSEAANAAYLELLRDHPLQSWFSRALRGAIKEQRMLPMLRSPRRERTLEAICSFGDWHRHYQGRLGELELPDLGD